MTGQVFGTPAYMPPEQIAGEPVDARSDQFAFCASLVHALTGRLPFQGATLGELRAEIEAGRIDPVALAKLPLAIRRIVTRGLAADPARRFPSMDALLGRLDGRRRAGVVAGIALVVGSAAIGGYFVRGSSPDACLASADRVAEVWTPAIRDTLPTEAERITTWTDRWRADREATCRAAAGGVDPRIDREALCLDGQLLDLGATLDALGDPGLARMAAHAIAALPVPARCHGAKPAPLSQDSRGARADRTRRRLAMLAAIEARGGATLAVLAGSPDAGNRIYALALPSARATELAPVPYPGDLWELRAIDAHTAVAFDRKLDKLVTIDRRTGAVVRVLGVSADIHHNGRGLAIAPGGTIIALAKGRSFAQLDPQTGVATPLSTLDAAYQLETMTYCPNGTLYAAASTGAGNAVGRTLVTVDPASGAVTAIGAIGEAIDIDVLACDRDGRLYGLDTINTDTNELYAIDARTGARTLIANIPGPVNGIVVE